METESAEQARERHIRDMGPELGGIYHALWREVTKLHIRWNLYREIYAHSPERYALLYQAAGHFFEVVEEVLYDDVFLGLMRIADSRRDTLSLRNLVKRVPDRALAKELNKLIGKAETACKPIKTHRDKRIAHIRREHTLAGGFDRVPSRAKVEDALGAVRRVMNRLEAHYWGSEEYEREGYEHSFSTAGGGADALVYYLRKGMKAATEGAGA
jgi:hypothetical protein